MSVRLPQVALVVAVVALCAAALMSETSAQRVVTIPVNVESDPAGAAVYLDTPEGQPLGTTPMRNIRIPRGQHTLIFKKENHEDARLPVDIRRRRETFRATLNPLSVINVTAGNTAAEGAAVRVDGQPVGNVPFRAQVQPGRHLVQVGKEGHVTFSQWADLSGGQVLQLPVMLEPEAPRAGSLLVAGDVTGATVSVDGTPRGTTPTVIEGITEGEHDVQVVSPQPGMQPHTERVRIRAGERTVINPILRPAPVATGSLRVLVRPADTGAIVSLDGEVIGEAPASKEQVPPGEHIVEARADGYEAAQQPVTIEGGSQRVLSITLTPIAGAPGRIVVNTNVDGASVSVDGEDRGAPPVVIEGASPGTHAIVVRAQGHQEHRETCSVGPGRNCEITANLRPVGTPVRVEANVEVAEFVVDGEVMGPVPWEGTLPVGSHNIEIRADGYRSYRAVVSLQPQSETRVFNAGLVGEGELTPEEVAEQATERRARHRQAVARSGAPLQDDIAVLDFSVGWPYIFELRMGIGVLPWLDAGIGLRTFFRVTEFEGRVKAGFRPVQQVSLGVQARIGGGIGVARDDTLTDNGMDDTDIEKLSTNDFFFSLEALFTLHFLRAGNFTLWGAMDYHSDSWSWNGANSDCRYYRGCVDEDSMSDGDISPDPAEVDEGSNDVIEGRQRVARFRLGGSLEFILSPSWNMWVSFEGVFGEGRRVLGDILGVGKEDIEVYTRLGFTYKFGYADD